MQSVWREYNPNPAGRKVGDCSVRAVSAALGVDWETAYALMAVAGFNMGDMPSNLNSPNDIIQHLMNSKQITQQQYERARQMAAQFRR